MKPHVPRLLNICEAPKITTSKTTNLSITWEEFVEKLRTPEVTQETFAEYCAMSKTQRCKVKDVGYFVGGQFKDGKRCNENNLHRDVLTLDYDGNVPFDYHFCLAEYIGEYEYVTYTTHSHSPEDPRIRLVIPLTRSVTPEEYPRLIKKVDALVGFKDALDPGSTQPERAMFYPSHSKDAEFEFYHNEGAWLDPDVLLAEEPEPEEKAPQEAQQELTDLESMTRGCTDLSTEQMKKILTMLDPDMQREQWVRVGMALHHQFRGSAEGLQLFDGWSASKGSVKYESGDCARVWNSFKQNPNNSATFKSVIAMAQEVDAKRVLQIMHSDLYSVEVDSMEQKTPFNLSKFSLRGKAEDMEKQMLKDVHVLGKLALLGQSTIFYAPTNAGKTLLTIWLLIQAIKSGDLKGENVFYINADDNHKGLTQKLKLAEKYGFEMLAPGYEGFEAAHLVDHLRLLSHEDTAREKVLILDTVKKFTDLMSKSDGTEFGKNAREFVLKGGTLIMLAHTNKHRDPEGKLVYQGTTDLKDDADCAYMIDVEESTYRKNVIFENIKDRGDVDKKAVYSYDNSQGRSHLERLESVQRVDEEEQKALEEQRKIKRMFENNQEAIEAIEEVLKDGAITKTELIKQAHGNSGISKRRIETALRDHTGDDILKFQYWILKVGDKNANIYQLNDMRRVKNDSDFWSGESVFDAV